LGGGGHRPGRGRGRGGGGRGWGDAATRARGSGRAVGGVEGARGGCHGKRGGDRPRGTGSPAHVARARPARVPRRPRWGVPAAASVATAGRRPIDAVQRRDGGSDGGCERHTNGRGGRVGTDRDRPTGGAPPPGRQRGWEAPPRRGRPRARPAAPSRDAGGRAARRGRAGRPRARPRGDLLVRHPPRAPAVRREPRLWGRASRVGGAAPAPPPVLPRRGDGSTGRGGTAPRR